MNIPDNPLNYIQITQQMKINVEILKKELSDHVDNEIERFKKEILIIKSPGYFE